MVVRETHADAPALAHDGLQRQLAGQIDVAARHAEHQDARLGGVLDVDGGRLLVLGRAGQVLGDERARAERPVLERDVVLAEAVTDAARRDVAELALIAHPRTLLQHVRRLATVHVDVEALVRPVAGEPLAGAELDVELVALGVAVLVDLVGLAVVLLHRRGPAVGARVVPAVPGVELGVGEQRRPLLPAPIAGELPELPVVAAIAGIRLVPGGDGLDEVVDARNAAVGLAEVVDQRAVEQVPGIAVAQLGHAVGVDDPPAGLEAQVAAELLDVGRRAAAHAVAVDVDRLHHVVHVVALLEELVGRGGLVAVLDDGLPDGECLLLVAHPLGDPRAFPRLEARRVLDLVRQHLDVTDHADVARMDRQHHRDRQQHDKTQQARSQVHRPSPLPGCRSYTGRRPGTSSARSHHGLTGNPPPAISDAGHW